MARGVDTSQHPGRYVGRDRHGWKWSAGGGTTLGGNVVSTAVHTYDPNYQHSIDIVEGRGGGYSAELDYVSGYYGRTPTMEVERYRAGPFRTQLRARIAGRALHNRAEGGGGKADPYHTGGYTETAQEARWNREGLL